VNVRTAYVSTLDIGSRMAHAMQVMKNAQAWAKASEAFEFLTCLSPLAWRRQDPAAVAELYGLSTPFAIKAWPLKERLWRLRLPLVQDIFFRLAARRCRDLEAELVFTRTYLAPRYLLAHNLSTVVETHSPPEDTPAKRMLYIMLHHPRVLAVVTISQELARLYREHGLPAEKILVAPDGVDWDAFQPELSRQEARRRLGLADDRPVAAYVGHLYPGRGVDHILEAAARLPGVRFRLVGGHPEDVARWRAEVERAGLANLELAGFVPNREVPLHLFAADALLMPYTTATPTAAWMSPLKMFEYLAAGRPVIASDLPAVREVLRDGDNALLCPPDSGEALAGALGRALEEPELAARLGAAGRREARGYSWDARVGRIMEFAAARREAAAGGGKG
jgi:glycosyltransferase involved in cell wall biosynthesis